jgi:hypothetical protein
MEYQKMLKPVSLYLELFNYIWDPPSVWFKLNSPVQKEQIFFCSLTLEDEVTVF